VRTDWQARFIRQRRLHSPFTSLAKLPRMRPIWLSTVAGSNPVQAGPCGYTAPDLVQRFHTLETSPVTFTQLLTVTKPDIVIFETFAAGWVAGPCDTLGVRFVVAVLCRTPRQTHG
jgi:hypothetical protein